MNKYEKGETVRITGTFTVSSVATDPTAVILKVQRPSGAESTYTYALSQVTKSSTGIYYKEIAANESGRWYYRWEGTGAVVSADEDVFFVKNSEF